MAIIAIQSLAGHNFVFPVDLKDGEGNVIGKHNHIVPGLNRAPKNILILDEKRFNDDLKDDKIFKDLVKSKVFRVLEDVPESYYDSSQVAAAAKAERDQALETVAQKDDVINSKDDRIKQLESQLKALGGAV